MDPSACMNAYCGSSSSIEWKRGWGLRSGRFANLCQNCGSAFEQSVFCDVFHAKESGWRECAQCGKRLHCGCIVSRSLLDFLDGGGVKCNQCMKNAEPHPSASDGKPDASKISEVKPTPSNNHLDRSNVDKVTLIQLDNNKESNGLRTFLQSHNNEAVGLLQKMKQDDVPSPGVEIRSTSLSIFNQASNVSSPKPEIYRGHLGINDTYESLPRTNLSMSLGAPSGYANHFPGIVVDEYARTSSLFSQEARSHHLLPKPPKLALATGLDENSVIASQARVARPPAEGRGRNQLLPRYWPRITDQELQQISGDPNSTIVPLFEKMLSASDAGRIGRLVLPKACAEAYFPPIFQPEGVPLRIQDVKGKEWVFQFRFWPNNNSRMYVLEGVTPCIQSMQLQAGDTVTFSRMDPEGKLIMGFRKASNPAAMQSAKGMGPHLSILSKQLTTGSGDMIWKKSVNPESGSREGFLLQSLVVPERKRTRNIGSKSKRLLIDSHDVLELKLTWEEAQDLLRPPPAVKPSTVMIDDLEFEEYEEPPVFGKRSIFIVRSTGEHEQWAQCDGCSKWRRLPADVLLPSKWMCTDNVWDQNRCSCSAPDELTPEELDCFLRMSKEFKKRRMATNHNPTREQESSGLDALANAAILGDNVAEPGDALVATTTKHPRHRPGCSCIVCIQPPSGKGKHKPSCTCQVCMTVKRRFKTLMINKKKRQSEREAEIAGRSQLAWGPRDDVEVDSTSRHLSSTLDPSDSEAKSPNELESKSQLITPENGKGKLDLNCHPSREADLPAGPSQVTMMSLVQVATLPLDSYLKQTGLTSLVTEQQTSSASPVTQEETEENDEQINADQCVASVVQDQESEAEAKQDQSPEDPL